ncbi:MAG: bifunctional proline dehydrogenase/L-glutamate gamma-semialdehyde dehydrogenase PutA [Stellaceae bacterium]
MTALQFAYRCPDETVFPRLIQLAGLRAGRRDAVMAMTRDLIIAMRRARSVSGIDAFLREYRISSPEGIVLLCLAEALLRIPDGATADALVRDKLTSGDWSSHIGQADSMLVNMSSLSLMLSGRFLSLDEAGGLMSRIVGRLGEPTIRRVVRTAMAFMGEQFIMGHTIERALARSRRPEARGFRYSFDMLGEGARTAADARRYCAAYRSAIDAIGKTVDPHCVDEAGGISVKLSALHPRFEPAQRARVLDELVPTVIGLAAAARKVGIPFTIDAEEADRLELSLEIFERAMGAPTLKGWSAFGIAVQAYQKRAFPLIGWIDDLGRRMGRKIPVRLVKGAYWDTEIKRAQERGLDGYMVFTRKSATDVSYLACARAMLDAPCISPAFATHNALTIATIVEFAGSRRDFEFQRLYGMADGLYEALLARDATYSCRTYAPVGGRADLLAYLARRLLENGANSSFVNRVRDDKVPIDSLLADPVDALTAATAWPTRIPLPAQIYGAERLNSSGVDLSDRATAASIEAELAKEWTHRWHAAPIINGNESGLVPLELTDPSNCRRIVSEIRNATSDDVDHAVSCGVAAQTDWDAGGVARRSACLLRAAELLELRRNHFMAIAIREGGKTIPDAVAEVRESVDFLRYYAVRAEDDFAPRMLPGPTGEENRLSLAGRGVFACISPWNFPLAIFTGQVAATLVAGNAVVAKPAPQTPFMAYEMIKLLHQAGVPAEVLHFVPGGTGIGEILVAHPLIAGVVFTGSTGAAKAIARQLAGKNGAIVPLVAETGGQNAMIVDSSALPEQVVDDLLTSAFRSAGQRCSAARLLFVQEDIADRVLDMLVGAMDELAIGDPALLATDIGPVIDRSAMMRLNAHMDLLQHSILRRLPVPDGGWFVGPTLIAIDSPVDLSGEVFGPVLHVIRWSAGKLGEVIDSINATGFGLTLGIHSRVGKTVEFVRRHARVGNLYVNRGMVGAVVGAQPFGGEGLSGTGPKAGGPDYIRRFATERVISVDTTATGGNAKLMAMVDRA